MLMITVHSCSTHKNSAPSEGKTKLQKIYVDSFDSETVVSKSDQLEVKVRGNLPSPAYTFERFDVQVKGKVIEIAPLAKFDADKIAMQVLIPFEKTCLVKNLKPGTYEIKVIGRGESILSRKNIQVRE